MSFTLPMRSLPFAVSILAVTLCSGSDCSSVQLNARPTATSFRVGEPIRLSISLRNEGGKAVYIPKRMQTMSGPDAWVEFRVFDSRGKSVPVDSFIAEPSPAEFAARDAREIVGREWMELLPNYTYSTQLTILSFHPKSGTYTVASIFHFPLWTAAQNESLRSLNQQVCGGELNTKTALKVVP